MSSWCVPCFIFTYFNIEVYDKLSCLAVSRAQDEWRANNLLQDIKYYRLHVTVCTSVVTWIGYGYIWMACAFKYTDWTLPKIINI